MNEYLFQMARADDAVYSAAEKVVYEPKKYDPSTHYLDVASSPYFRALLIVRHYLKLASDIYFTNLGAKNVDLFMMTPSVSSPMGSGSNSEAIPFQFGKLEMYMVDSSQFGFEPILMNGFEKVYCYLPSMRGEDPDARHLNQFFHCEAELKGSLEKLLPIVEGYIKALCNVLLHMPNIISKLSSNYDQTYTALSKVNDSLVFQKITFDEAWKMLKECKKDGVCVETNFGRDITPEGEFELMRLLKSPLPLWVTSCDRDRVAFYQKPDPKDSNKVINADFIFPPLVDGAFGGEIVGAGQRQDNPSEMRESLKRQKISADPYEWYINLREQPSYTVTSGFGLGIERFITWILGRDDIRDAIVYPRLKNSKSSP